MGLHEQAKPFRDLVPADDWRAVKLAIRQTVARVGKAEAVAAHFKEQNRGFDGGRISEWCDPDKPTSLPTIWQVGQLEAFAGVDWITQAMCALHDGDLVKRGRAESQGEILARIGSAAKESGEALSSAASVLAKPDCPKSREAAIRECHEAIRSKKELLAALEAVSERAV